MIFPAGGGRQWRHYTPPQPQPKAETGDAPPVPTAAGRRLPECNLLALSGGEIIIAGMEADARDSLSEKTPLCAAQVIFRVTRGRWALSILSVIAERGPIHFLALGRSIPGISRKVPSEQLRYLLEAGVIRRSGAKERQEVFYTLSNRGRELKTAIDGLTALAERWEEL